MDEISIEKRQYFWLKRTNGRIWEEKKKSKNYFYKELEFLITTKIFSVNEKDLETKAIWPFLIISQRRQKRPFVYSIIKEK